MAGDARFRFDLSIAGLFAARVLHCDLRTGNIFAEPDDWFLISNRGSRDRGVRWSFLPTRGSDEFKPFIRRLPEFKFWYSISKAICIAFVMTFFTVFDVPVFWPILLCYWIVLFFLTMKRQIMHMIKYKYIPFNVGKQKYTGKTPQASSNTSRD
ncbi:hypothetical protein HPP92_023421 [Vanilla planifolia]|uniref:Protein RER1 n=1 Tax=Vanilla planifolia TaxID=51239 RepID=A0A835PVA3_VANPL|nr:hypothetical protein HPP92_023421 [Vanilla planifolia]